MKLELENLMHEQIGWSLRVFGAGRRTVSITKHIQKEIVEIIDSPDDTREWIDIIILGMDGYWRAGGSPASLLGDLHRKMAINRGRIYPFPKNEIDPVEHVRDLDELKFHPRGHILREIKLNGEGIEKFRCEKCGRVGEELGQWCLPRSPI